MPDTVDPKTRSRIMSAVRSGNTKLEWDIRRRLFAMGFRYRLHRRDLPGTPDMVFPKYQSVVFVHGCFWHYHGCPPLVSARYAHHVVERKTGGKCGTRLDGRPRAAKNRLAYPYNMGVCSSIAWGQTS